MMFVDASAIVAILTAEPEQEVLIGRLESATTRTTSAIAIFEATLAIARKLGIDSIHARALVLELLQDSSIRVTEIGEAVAEAAVDAHARYGRGRHPAALNMGDCFAYACASLAGAELLYKGQDFDATDLRAPKG